MDYNDTQYAEAWLHRNNITMDSIDDLISFCNNARDFYCKNRFTADTNKNGVFDPEANLLVFCTNAPNVVGEIGMVLFSFSILSVFAKLFFSLKNHYTLNETKEEAKLGMKMTR